MQVGFLGSLACQFCHAGYGLAFPFAVLDFLLNHLCHVTVDMQVVIDLLLDEVAYIFVDGIAVRSHHRRAEFYLCLAFKDRLLHIDGNSGHDTRSDVTILILAEKLLDGLGNMLLEGTLVCAALCGVLSVDKRVVLLAILVGMGEGYLDVVTLQVDNGIKRIVGHAVA